MIVSGQTGVNDITGKGSPAWGEVGDAGRSGSPKNHWLCLQSEQRGKAEAGADLMGRDEQGIL